FLGVAPVSVTHKRANHPGIGRNDYVSVGRYVHRAPDGTWRIVDGVTNEAADPARAEAQAYDRYRFQTMVDAVTALTLAAEVTRGQQYARHALSFVRTWFIDDNTRMNPHLRFAQIRPDRQA